MSVGLLLDFGSHVEGLWVYKDTTQIRITQYVMDVLAWDLVAFDAWLYGPQHWRGYPKVRQHMMGLREQLTFALATPADDERRQTEDIKDYFRSTRRLAMRMKNLPDALRLALSTVDPGKLRRAALALQSKSHQRIQQEYETMVLSGQKYGAQTELARKYGLPLHTLRKTLKFA